MFADYEVQNAEITFSLDRCRRDGRKGHSALLKLGAHPSTCSEQVEVSAGRLRSSYGHQEDHNFLWNSLFPRRSNPRSESAEEEKSCIST